MGMFASFFKCALSKMSLCPSNSSLWLFADQESTCPLLWGEEGTCLSFNPASFLGKWIYWVFFSRKPHHCPIIPLISIPVQ